MLQEGTITGITPFLTGLIDHAGLFPPRSITLEKMVAEYAELQQSEEADALSHCIIPVAQLADVSPEQIDLFSEERPMQVAVLAMPSSDIDTLVPAARQTATHIDGFRTRHGTSVVVDKVDVRAPRLGDQDTTAGQMMLEAAQALGEGLSVFFEAAAQEEAQTLAVVRRLQQDVKLAVARPDSIGFKFRCGHATDPKQFPSVRQIAYALSTCSENGVAIKFTAGLHHPIRHLRRINDLPLETDSHVMMHGFLNVFGAAILLHAGKIEANRLEEILSDTEVSHFVFDETGFSWKGTYATMAEIKAAREHFALGYGSCSFDEPIDDLRALGIL